MKRSGRIALLSMGASALVLSACEEPRTEAAVFREIGQCVETEGLTEEQCRDAFRAARDQHAEVAPKYTSVADCEVDFGAGGCEPSPYRTQSGGGVFMPLMAGFMMGRMMGGGFGQPLYRSRDDVGNLRTADNRSVGNKIGRTQVSRYATAQPSRKFHTQRRGGFGASARATGFGAGA